MATFFTSLRLAAVTLLICCSGYTALILAFAQVFTPHTANGSLLERPDGGIVGSRLLAQPFTQPRYFWPRPSAVDYNGAGAGGSNKSPTNSDLTQRAQKIVAAYGASPERRLPAELAAASGGGLDPHISVHAAEYQVDRVAAARGIPVGRVAEIVDAVAFSPGGLIAPERIVNVLELNLALDRMH